MLGAQPKVDVIATARPLVGRERELDLLGQLLEQARAGAAQFVFISGEPGIGKTSLVASLLRMADERGFLTLSGSAAEFERELPFGLVVDALDEYLASLEPYAFHRLAADDQGELAGVFPALRSLNSGAGPTTATERFRAHHAVRELLERLAVTQPVALVFDDIQWADGASLELAAHLLRRPPRAGVLVAATFRTGQADPALLAALDAPAVEDGVVRVELGPLTKRDADALVVAASPAERERLYAAGEGNPFYMLELARAGRGAGRRLPDGEASVPAAVAAAIVRELDGVSSGARALANAAAVAGDPFELDLAIAIAGLATDDALGPLDELIDSDLVRPGEVPRRFRFRHPLVRNAVYESCPIGLRLAAHSRAAGARAARGEPATARAHHVEQSAAHGDLAAVAVLLEAAQATAERAPESAARWFAAALRLLPVDAPPARRIELLTRLAGAQAATGRFEDSRAALLEAIALAGQGDAGGRLAAACARTEQLLGRHEEARQRLTGVLEGLPDPVSPDGFELRLALAGGAFFRSDFEEMQGEGMRAMGVATALADELSTVAASAMLALAGAFGGDIPAGKAHRLRAARILDALPDDRLALRLDAVTFLGTAELYLDLYEEAVMHGRRGLAVARSAGQGEFFPALVPVVGVALFALGRVTEAADAFDTAIEAARLSGNAQSLGWSLLNRSMLARLEGDLDKALSLAEESAAVTARMDRTSLVTAHVSVVLAHALCEAGHPERAIEAAIAGAGGEELVLIPGGWRASYFELLTRCWLALDRPAEAEAAAARAEAVAADVSLEHAAAMAYRARAAVSLHAGDAALAAEQALAAAAAADTVGARVDAALCRVLAGRALAAAGDADRAQGELERAAAALDACGAPRYRDAAEREWRKLGGHPPARTRAKGTSGKGLDALSRREHDVARLVVDRRTNPEIAAELFLSVKTVETHMRNMFRKLGVSSRADLARAVEQAAAPR
jgi:DNA-binding NarL/FixJ family response regulator/tetratricopeptide (TPR) repeat protein